MMRRAASTCRATIAGVLCAALLLTSFSSAIHACDDHDSDCASPSVAAPDGSAPTVSASESTTDGQPVHCLVCHLSRSFRPRGETTLVSAPAVTPRPLRFVDTALIIRNFPVSQPPLRSPPA